MSQLTREHTPRAIATGMWIGLWTGEVIAAGEYWLARGASFGLSTLRAWMRRPVLYFSIATVAASGTLMSVNINFMLKDAQIKTAILDQQTIISGVDLYRIETGHIPPRLEAMVPNYLRELHLDPWGRPYAYYQGKGGAAVVSAGPDGKLGTGDDILIVSPPALKAGPDGFVQIVHERGK